MKKVSVLFFSLILCISFNTAQAQTAEEIVNNYIEALGGEKALSAITSIVYNCSAKAQGMDIPIVMYQKAPGLQRMDMTFQGKTITQMSFDGTEGWGTNFMTMEAEKWDAQQSEMMKAESEFLDPFLGWKEKGYTLSLEGEEEVEGTACYKVKLTKKPVTIDGKEEENFSYCFFEKESFALLMQRSFEKMGEAKGQASETYFGDYEEVEGADVIMARSISQKMNGMTVFALTIDNIELNKELENSFFAFPAPAVDAAGDKK